MDRVTQSNAKSAEEGAAASEHLAHQSTELSNMVHQLNQLLNGPPSSRAISAH